AAKGGRARKGELNVGRLAVMAVAAALVIALIWLGAKVVSYINDEADMIEMPLVLGMTEAEATAQLNELGLVVQPLYKANAEVPAGEVAAQSVPEGAEVSAGRVVELTISQGEPTVPVPSVLGTTQGIAELTLANAGFVVNVREEYNEEVPKGVVAIQSPAANTAVAEGSTVEIIVSLGKEGEKFVMIDLRGKTLTEANALLLPYEMTIMNVSYAQSYEYMKDQITAQSIEAGSETMTGGELDVTISEGPGPAQKSAMVSYMVPEDESMHIVSIVVIDVSGTNEVYNQIVEPGTLVATDVSYYNSGTAEVYLDGVRTYTQALE
ncbi:MAG: PASTA domain-containing protein, partial [Bacillota bacterium]|nr:PASTA domain-containing protein [Bacillota bacterium]